MSDPLGRATEVLAWLDSGPPKEDIARRILTAEDGAYRWYCAQLHMTAEERERFRGMVDQLRASGFVPPAGL